MGMARPPFPRSLREFQRQFASEEACEDIWPPVVGLMDLSVRGVGTSVHIS